MPTDTNVHGDALCCMVTTWATTETVSNNGWRLVAVGGWWLVAVVGWRLVAVGGGCRLTFIFLVVGLVFLFLVVGGGWCLAVGGWGFLRAVWNKTENGGS